MRLTPILRVQSWISKLRPMPTTPKDNGRLLSRLDSCFQQQSDDSHPSIQPTDPPRQLSTPISGPAVGTISATATTNHLQSSLQHPLPGQRKVPHSASESPAAKAAAMVDETMRSGELDLDLMTKCMRIYVETSPKRGHLLIDEFGLGRRLSSWFACSSAATREQFLSSHHTLSSAVPILYADGLEEDVWGWLQMLYAGNRDARNNQLQQSQRVLHQVHLTYLMIKEAVARSGLDAAMIHFSKTCDHMQSTAYMSLWVLTSPPWRALIGIVTKKLLRGRDGHGISTDTYDHFLQHQSLWSDSAPFTFELACIYHPTRPSAEELVTTLGQENAQVEALFDRLKDSPPQTQKAVLNGLLDGARLLIQQSPGSIPQGESIIKLVEQQYPRIAEYESGKSPPKRIYSIRKAISLHLSVPAATGVA